MRFLLFTHSLASDWNHGNAHFQRGILRELQSRGHEALAVEPAQGWSRTNLLADQGSAPLARFHEAFPQLETRLYNQLDEIEDALAQADVVIVHEWTDPAVIAALGRRRAAGARFILLYHDTHHRAVSEPDALAQLPLEDYDGILAFGEVLAEIYRAQGWGRRAYTWHEAADTRLFRPPVERRPETDAVWVGNWGDDERSTEIERLLVGPVRRLGLSANVYGVRYPEQARATLDDAGIAYRGWLANADVPAVFARHRLTVHIPRRHYAEKLPGIPTIRMFEALACGIPLISAPWRDSEALFRAGDYLTAGAQAEMEIQMRRLLNDPELAASLGRNGRQTVLERHSCARRVEELMTILEDIHPARMLAATEAAE